MSPKASDLAVVAVFVAGVILAAAYFGPGQPSHGVEAAPALPAAIPPPAPRRARPQVDLEGLWLVGRKNAAGKYDTWPLEFERQDDGTLYSPQLQAELLEREPNRSDWHLRSQASFDEGPVFNFAVEANLDGSVTLTDSPSGLQVTLRRAPGVVARPAPKVR
jgi:hypothetical protein